MDCNKEIQSIKDHQTNPPNEVQMGLLEENQPTSKKERRPIKGLRDMHGSLWELVAGT